MATATEEYKTSPRSLRNSSAEGVCSLCGHKGGRLIQQGLRGGQAVDVVQCGQCSLVYLWPVMNDFDEAAFYKANQQWKELYVDQEINDEYMYKKCEPDAERRAAILRPYLKRDRRLLEIGCGHGNFLQRAKPLVSEAVGLELGESKIEFCRKRLGLTMVNDFDSLVRQGEKFDLICLFHVLEHLKSPLQILESLKRILSPKGLVIFEVPNIWDPILRLYRVPQFKQFYFQIAHVSYFSPTTLRLAASRSGYDIIIRGVQRYGLPNHWHWFSKRRPMLDDPLRSLPGVLKGIDTTYKAVLSVTPFADTLVGICRLANLGK